jgi:hypothetical protein
MAETISKICDPECYPLGEAIQQARLCMVASPGFELDLVKFLQTQCLSRRVHLRLVLRGVEILGAIVEEARLITLLRPFLRSSDSQIASKCVLVLGRRSCSVGWLRSVMSESDERIRANLIESIWNRKEPEVEQILQDAVKDRHHRVAANAVYGLYLIGSELYPESLDYLIGHANDAFRRSAVWVIRSSGAPESALKIRSLIKDADAGVRHAAFEALVHLRGRGTPQQCAKSASAGKIS